MKRLIICLDGFFPRGDAGANRIYYLAKILQNIKKEVIILACDRGQVDKECIYNDVKYYTWHLSQFKILNYLQKKIFCGLNIIKLLKKISINSNDIVLIYGSNSLFTRIIINFCKRLKIKTVLDVVEWHQPFEYKFGIFNFRYLSAGDNFYNVSKKVDKVIAISSVIKKYFESQGIVVYVIPPLTDVSEYKEIKFLRKDENQINIIYPGKPFGKDNIRLMLKCLVKLPEECKNKMYFHMTGISKKDLEKHLGNDKYLIECLDKHIILHGWLEYQELYELYQNMDYFYIYRNKTKLTLANFPSKLPELLKFGIIPICNCIGDYTSYLEDNKNSLFFDNSNDVDILIKAINMPIYDRERMRINARQCAEDKFDISKWKEKVMDILDL